MKKSIFFILPNLESGGAERIITILANHLDREKFTPTLVLFEKKGSYLEWLEDDVKIIELNVSRIRYSIFKIIPLIKKYKPDIVFTGWGEISAFLAPIIPFFKKTIFITRETNIVSKHVTRKEIKFFYKFYNNFHHVIAQSNDMLEDLVENMHVKQEKVIKINNPIDFDLIENKLKENGEKSIYNKLEKNVLAVGSLSYRKGFDLLLNVFSYLKSENIQLHILGEGALKEELVEQKEKLGLEKVHFHGQKNNPFPWMQQADLFVLSSRHEGFPNVLLEANACGTYALANNCKGGINEIIQKGINGEISAIENEKEFAEKIKKWVNEEHQPKKIQQSVRDRYNISIILEKYTNLLENA